jgi:N-acetyl-alpha-D-muramate 1-phosphate uridylyltransferase
MRLPVAILAGGMATRLRPNTDNIPKALVDVAGKPFVLRQLEYLRRQGVSRVVLCVGFLGEQIEALVGNGSSSGLSVAYSQDWPKLQGTGGALRQALPLLGPQFLVLYGDSYLFADFAAVERAFLSSGKPALMTVHRNTSTRDKSNVLFLDNVIVEYNKSAPTPEMQHIDYCLGAVSARIFANEPAAEAFDLADVYHRLSLSGDLAGYEVHEPLYEIGSHEGLLETAEYFRSKTE